MWGWAGLLGLGCMLLNEGVVAVDVSDSKLVSRIAFGSCNKHDREQPIWDSVAAAEPDLFVWLGDVVYNDRFSLGKFHPATSGEEMQLKYDTQKAVPSYKSFLEKVPRVLAVWDDHDFGINNGGSSFALKDESKDRFLAFLGESKSSPRRTRKGLYGSYSYGPAGKRVTVILLDVRYFKDEHEGELLGSEQWSWLEETLRTENNNQLYLIGSGIQVLPTDRPFGEKWASYPKEQARLLKTIGAADLSGTTVLLSGDVHFAEMTCVADEQINHPLLEITSSGLTHAWGELGQFFFVPRPFAYLARMFMAVMPARYQLDTIDYQRNISAVHGANYYNQLNFGSIDIDWSAQKVKLGIADVHGATVMNHTFSLNKTAFHSDFVACAKSWELYDSVAPTLSLAILGVISTIVAIDLCLLLYLIFRIVGSLLSEEKKKKQL